MFEDELPNWEAEGDAEERATWGRAYYVMNALPDISTGDAIKALVYAAAFIARNEAENLEESYQLFEKIREMVGEFEAGLPEGVEDADTQ